MACERHGYTNNVFCPACDNEYLDKIDTVERMWSVGKRTDEIAAATGFQVYAVINMIKSFLERKAEL